VFIMSLGLMGSCTFSIGFLPARETIGALAGVLLVALRIVQGICVGGEYGGGAANIGEWSPAKSRGFYVG
jgi:MFS family permease